MEFVAVQKNTRQTPRKVRLVANQIKDLPLEKALRQLAVIRKKSTLVLLKVMKQAMANAKNNHNVAVTDLEIKEIRVDEGSRYKRFRAVSRGRAHNVIKRNSHVTVVLAQKSAPVAGSTQAVASTTEKNVTSEKSGATKTSAKAEKVAPKKETKSKTVKQSTKKAAKPTKAAAPKKKTTSTKKAVKK